MDIPEFDLPSAACCETASVRANGDAVQFQECVPLEKGHRATGRNVPELDGLFAGSGEQTAGLTEDEGIVGPGPQFAFLEFLQQRACRQIPDLEQPVTGRGQQIYRLG